MALQDQFSWGGDPQANIQAEPNHAQSLTDQDTKANSVITQFLLRNVPEFRELSRLREKGWRNPKGDQFFQEQRRRADAADQGTQKFFYQLMKRMAEELHQATGVFRIKDTNLEPPSILDMCMAPGGFLAVVLDLNPRAHASCFSLPAAQGGHSVLLPDTRSVDLKYLDVTMLAEDLGITEIPAGHPDIDNFLAKQFEPGQAFDLVLCDGQVLRKHTRALYREYREARRLTLTQLSLGLEHLKSGGSMVLLLHKVEAWETVCLMHQFSKFSSIKLFKSKNAHAKRSSFYMLCTEVPTRHPEAISAIEDWKKTWKIATFANDEDYRNAILPERIHVEQVRDNFGLHLADLGRDVWAVQAEALAKAPFIKD